ncbi:MAG: hypothetical protein IPJ88_02640 [Myxococcales bacterium]|nr:MAG: hypothetical protein IPJ88_02640 [Myxococcales bacterium]
MLKSLLFCLLTLSACADEEATSVDDHGDAGEDPFSIPSLDVILVGAGAYNETDTLELPKGFQLGQSIPKA